MSESPTAKIREFFEVPCNGRWLSEIVHVLEIMNGSDERKEIYGSVLYHHPTLTKKYRYIEKNRRITDDLVKCAAVHSVLFIFLGKGKSPGNASGIEVLPDILKVVRS